MGIIQAGTIRLLLIGCALACLQARAEGQGVVVLQRDVQPVAIGRERAADPDPLTVNVNASQHLVQSTGNELNDGDFAGISSGARIIGKTTVANGNGNAGLNLISHPSGLPGLGSGHGAGNEANLSGTINRSISAGLSPLNQIGGK